MSAVHYVSKIDDDVYGTLILEMNGHGQLRIIAYDPGTDELVGCCQFPPSTEGLNEAQRLINALQEWTRHVKEDLNPCRVVLDSDALSRSMSSHVVATRLLSTPQMCIDCLEKFWTSIPGRDICAACYAHREQEVCCFDEFDVVEIEDIDNEQHVCLGVVPGTCIACGEGGNYCSNFCERKGLR